MKEYVKDHHLFYENSMIAICDILGFKMILNSYTLKEIVEDNTVYLRRALYRSIFKHDPPTNNPTLAEIQEQNRVGLAWFSDTILLYSLEDNIDSYRELIETSAWLLMHTIIVEKARLRVGISYGNVFIDPQNQTYLGKAIAEADELQKKQEWSGGALTKSAEEKIPAEIISDNFPAPWYLVQYKVPLKSPKELISIDVKSKDGRPESPDIPVICCMPMLAIDWTRFLHKFIDFPWSPTNDEPDYATEPKDHIMKWINTKEFHRKVCWICEKTNKHMI